MKFREANRNDIFEIVKMIAHDKLGKLREDFRDPLPDKYYAAFDNIHKDDNQELIVLENDKREIIEPLSRLLHPHQIDDHGTMIRGELPLFSRDYIIFPHVGQYIS